MRNPLPILGLCLLIGPLAPLGASQARSQGVAPPAPPRSGEPVDDFDFWLGQWTVHNTRLQPDGVSFQASGEARATVEPVLGGDAVLERWEGLDGPIEGTFGLSLRYFDQARGRWVVLLNWPGGSPPAAQFGRMEGGFDDGMIALHPARVYVGNFEKEQYTSTRFVFSDVAEDSCRWVMQKPGMNGRWDTTWAMDFVRDEPAQAGPMRIDEVPKDRVCDSAESRMTDWLVGAWSGEGVELRVSSAIRGCGIIASVQVDRPDAQASALLIVTWDERSGSWQVRELGLNRPLISLVWEAVGRVTDRGMALRSVGPDDLGGMVFQRLEGDGMQFELTLPDTGKQIFVELSRQ